MCLPPQQRAFLEHPNWQKCFQPGVLLTFSLRHVLHAAMSCNFSSLTWPDGSAPTALASLFFNPPEPQTIGNLKKCFDSLPFQAPASSLLFSSLRFASLLFSCLLSLVSCLLSLVSCLLSLVSCLLSLVSCLLSLVSCLLSLVSCLLSLVSCLLSLVSCLLSLLFSFLTAHIVGSLTSNLLRSFYDLLDSRLFYQLLPSSIVFHHDVKLQHFEPLEFLRCSGVPDPPSASSWARHVCFGLFGSSVHSHSPSGSVQFWS